MHTEHNTKPKPKLRWYQYRLRSLLIAMTVIAVLLSIWNTLSRFLDYVEGPISERGFDKIELGMSLDKVEATLGRGEQISPERVTQIHGSPDAKKKGQLDLVIDGDQFYKWHNGGRRIELGIRNGKVCDKFYWEPSL